MCTGEMITLEALKTIQKCRVTDRTRQTAFIQLLQVNRWAELPMASCAFTCLSCLACSFRLIANFSRLVLTDQKLPGVASCPIQGVVSLKS
jgi:hypothetical protein